MKIASYSDLHLEFKHGWSLPSVLDADILLLAGDIIFFNDFMPLKRLLANWKKLVIFVPGNHEYYTDIPMHEHHSVFRDWLATELPQVHLLCNEYISIDGVNFFGGTMWTDFQAGDATAMRYAAKHMNDFRLIRAGESRFTPEGSIELHREFATRLNEWFEMIFPGPRVVVTHHAPVSNPKSQHLGSPLQPAFIAYDMRELIEKYEPDIWIYGHTHECDAQTAGKTRIISNQLGYPLKSCAYECSKSFDPLGCPVEIV